MPVLLILLGLAIVGELFYYFSLKKKAATPEMVEVTKDEGAPTISPAEKLSNLEIAKRVLGCLEGQVNENGLYAVGSECKQGEGCKKFLPGNYIGIYAMWARFNYLQKVSDPGQMFLFDRDLGVYSDSQKVPIIMAADGWTCRLLAVMAKSDLFSTSQKEKLASICQRSLIGGESIRIGGIEEEIKKGNYREPSWEDFFTQIRSESSTVAEVDSYELSSLAYFVSDFAGRYSLNQNNQELQEAKLIYQDALSLYLQGGKKLPFYTKALLGIAALDLLGVTGEDVFLDLASLIWEKLDLEKVCWLVDQPDSSCRFGIQDPVLVGIFAADLYQKTGREEYRAFKDKIITNLLPLCFDSPSFASAFNDNCFFSNVTTNFSREVTNNSLMVELLTED